MGTGIQLFVDQLAGNLHRQIGDIILRLSQSILLGLSRILFRLFTQHIGLGMRLGHNLILLRRTLLLGFGNDRNGLILRVSQRGSGLLLLGFRSFAGALGVINIIIDLVAPGFHHFIDRAPGKMPNRPHQDHEENEVKQQVEDIQTAGGFAG